MFLSLSLNINKKTYLWVRIKRKRKKNTKKQSWSQQVDDKAFYFIGGQRFLKNSHFTEKKKNVNWLPPISTTFIFYFYVIYFSFIYFMSFPNTAFWIMFQKIMPFICCMTKVLLCLCVPWAYLPLVITQLILLWHVDTALWPNDLEPPAAWKDMLTRHIRRWWSSSLLLRRGCLLWRLEFLSETQILSILLPALLLTICEIYRKSL